MSIPSVRFRVLVEILLSILFIDFMLNHVHWLIDLIVIYHLLQIKNQLLFLFGFLMMFFQFLDFRENIVKTLNVKFFAYLGQELLSLLKHSILRCFLAWTLRSLAEIASQRSELTIIDSLIGLIKFFF